MKIAYCTNVRLPSERAHGHQISQVCDALSHLGHRVTIIAPYRKNVVKEEYRTYYGAASDVSLERLGSFDPIEHPLLPGAIGLWVLNALLRRSMRRSLDRSAFDLAYTRSPALMPALLMTGVPVVLELHQLPRWGRRRFVRMCGRCRLIVCLTSAMREELLVWGVPPGLVIVEGDGVDLRRFSSLPALAQARAAWGIATDRRIVGYVGRLRTLGMEKGVGFLLEALRELQGKKEYFGLIVGGPAGDREDYERQARRLGLTSDDVRFLGDIPAAAVPVALVACDILAMPFPDFPHYRRNMSPLKMFEYMAAGRPIVTSDLPTIRDVLSESSAVFCRPGDARSLAEAIAWTGDHPAEAAERAAKALSIVERHSWEERMRRILTRAS